MRYDCKSNNYHLIYRQSFCKKNKNNTRMLLMFTCRSKSNTTLFRVFAAPVLSTGCYFHVCHLMAKEAEPSYKIEL